MKTVDLQTTRVDAPCAARPAAPTDAPLLRICDAIGADDAVVESDAGPAIAAFRQRLADGVVPQLTTDGLRLFGLGFAHELVGGVWTALVERFDEAEANRRLPGLFVVPQDKRGWKATIQLLTRARTDAAYNDRLAKGFEEAGKY